MQYRTSAGNPPLSGTVVGGVVVNAGDFCVLGGANVSGGVQVNDGGILIVCGSTINGGFIANGAAGLIFGAEEIDCAGDVINGAVQISNTGPVLFRRPRPPLRSNAVPSTAACISAAIAARSLLRATGSPVVCFAANNAFDLDNEGLSNVITGAIRCKFGD